MQREPAWRRYLRLFGADPAGDFDDEIAFHLETKVDELIASGYPQRQARAEAMRQFGPVRAIRRECTRVSRGRRTQASRAEYFAGWARDVRYALRSLLRSKASTAAALLILAVGLGATTAIYRVADGLILAKLPVPYPEQLVRISASRNFTPDEFANLGESDSTFGGVAAEAGMVFAEHHGNQKIGRPALGVAVSGTYFPVLGITPQLGRTLGPADRSNAVVISYRFWSRRFSNSPDALGQVLYFKDMPFTIVGVLPRGFFGLHRAVDYDAYLPFAGLAPDTFRGYANQRWLEPFARLRPGVTQSEAQARTHLEIHDLSAGTAGAWGEQRRSLWLLAGIVVVLLLIGCANVACLLVARGTARRQEMAVRIAVGASRARVMRQCLLENCLLTAAGGAAGLALALPVERVLAAAFHWQDRPIDFSLDGRLVAFSAALAIVTGALFGLAPLWQVWRGGRLMPIPERTLTTRIGSGKALVILEVALSMVLVAGAAVFLRSFQNLRAVPTGFSTDHVSYIELGNAAEPESLRAPFHDAELLAQSLRGAPGVQAVTVADLLTFDDSWIGYDVTAAGEPGRRRKVHLLRIDGDYFATLGIALRAGRTFSTRDDARAPRVAILSEGAARRLFRGESPLGGHIVLGGRDTEVVGVAHDIKFSSVAAPAPNVVFQPLSQGEDNSANTSTLKLHVRGALAPAQLTALVRSRIRDMNLAVSAGTAAPLADAIASTMANDRLRMQASSAFGSVALALIAAGIYGLMAYSVSMRTREIGVRMAVGSQPNQIVAMVLCQGLRLTLAGVLVGIPGAIAVMKAVSRLVFGLAPIDWPSVAIAALMICVTGILASVVPAWRGARLDPVQALRVQ
jgi:predicted permease